MTGCIIALDMAQKTGWAVVDCADGRIIASGMQDFTKGRGESNGLMFLRFSKWLRDLPGICPSEVRIVAFERAHMRGGSATEICVGMQTRAQELAAEIGAEPAPVHTATLKKALTGNGKAGKDAMIEAARGMIGRDPIDDNEADAVCVGVWAWKKYC